MKTLIVEDHAEDRKILRYYLESLGHTVLEARNGEEGLDICNSELPDLIISDILLPVMDGFHFLRKVRQSSTLQHIPFAFYSAVYNDAKDRELAMSLGADAFIVKPKDPEEFWIELSRIIKGYNLSERSTDHNLIAGEEEYLRQYSATLSAKLQQKITELEEANERITRLNAELERRVAERTAQLEAANRELEAFSFSASHDLRAPLRSIDGFSKALMEEGADSLNEQCRDYLSRICRASERMGSLIHALLDLSHLTRGEIYREQIDLSDMAHEIAAELQKSAPNRNVTFHIANGIIANGDARLVRTILENLLGNAWKYTGGKEHAIIEFGRLRISGERIYFVRDNGAGFDMKYADKLFVPFQRLHRMEEFEGSGIGLATVQRIINRHGGRVWADAELNDGAVFNFTIGEEWIKEL